jgi:hypothetical protein
VGASNLPRGKNGKPLPSPGRPKGVPNKLTTDARAAIMMAFYGIGGVEKMVAWATLKVESNHHEIDEKGKKVIVHRVEQPNLSTFYTQVFPKVLPLTMQGNVKVDVRRVSDPLEELYNAYLSVRASSGPVSRDAVVIEAGDERENIPQLVLSSKTGPKAA